MNKKQIIFTVLGLIAGGCLLTYLIHLALYNYGG